MGCWRLSDYRQRIKELEEEIKQIKHDNVQAKIMAGRKAAKIERKRCRIRLLAHKKKMGQIYHQNYMKWAQGIEKRVKDRANKKVSKRLDAKRLLATKHTSYIDGVLAFPVIHTYSIAHNIAQDEMVFLILVCLIERITAKECIKYGFARIAYSNRKLKALTGYGLAEVFQGEKSVYYTPSVKGMTFFKAFQTYYFKQVRLILGSDEYKRRGHKWE